MKVQHFQCGINSVCGINDIVYGLRQWRFSHPLLLCLLTKNVVAIVTCMYEEVVTLCVVMMTLITLEIRELEGSSVNHFMFTLSEPHYNSRLVSFSDLHTSYSLRFSRQFWKAGPSIKTDTDENEGEQPALLKQLSKRNRGASCSRYIWGNHPIMHSWAGKMGYWGARIEGGQTCYLKHNRLVLFACTSPTTHTQSGSPHHAPNICLVYSMVQIAKSPYNKWKYNTCAAYIPSTKHFEQEKYDVKDYWSMIQPEIEESTLHWKRRTNPRDWGRLSQNGFPAATNTWTENNISV